MYIHVMRNIDGFDGVYSIDELGNIFSARSGKMLKHINVNDGYKRVCLCKDGWHKMYLVHRLIAEYFIPNPEHKPCVNHKNGIKEDNSIDNLEWVTHSENLSHAYDSGLNKKPRPVEALNDNGIVVHRYKSAREAERDGFSNQNIYHCCSGHRKKHLGFKWRYSDES